MAERWSPKPVDRGSNPLSPVYVIRDGSSRGEQPVCARQIQVRFLSVPLSYGEVAESGLRRLSRKQVTQQGFGGSNPSLSAIMRAGNGLPWVNIQY